MAGRLRRRARRGDRPARRRSAERSGRHPAAARQARRGLRRRLGLARDRKDTLVTRKLPSWAANALISRISGVQLHDYGCTLKAYRRAVLSGRAPLRRDAPLHPDLRRAAGRARHRGGRAPPPAPARHDQVRPRPRAQRDPRSAAGAVPVEVRHQADPRLRQVRPRQPVRSRSCAFVAADLLQVLLGRQAVRRDAAAAAVHHVLPHRLPVDPDGPPRRGHHAHLLRVAARARPTWCARSIRAATVGAGRRWSATSSSS